MVSGYMDSASINPQCYFAHDSRESSGTLYHYLDALVARDAFSVDSSNSHLILDNLTPMVLFIPQCIQ